MRAELEVRCWCRVGLCAQGSNVWARLWTLVLVSWPPYFPAWSLWQMQSSWISTAGHFSLHFCIYYLVLIIKLGPSNSRSCCRATWPGHFMPPGYMVPESPPSVFALGIILWGCKKVLFSSRLHVLRSRWSLNMCGFLTQGAEEILGVVPVVKELLLHIELSLADGFTFCAALLSLSSMSWQRPLY